MATLFTLSSSSSTFISSRKTRKHLSLLGTKSTLQFKRPLSVTVNSLLSSEYDPLPPAVQIFWQWMCDEGVVSSKTLVKPGVFREGLGLVAQRDLAQNEAVLQVPKRLWINPDTVSASEIGDVCDGLKPWVSVALFLIREKLRDDSPWRYYIDILPEYTNSTIYWSEEELSEIQGTQLLSTTLDVKEYVQREFRKVEEVVIFPHKQLFPSPITLDDFFWAFGTIRSRAFSRLRGQSLVLMPLVDLINHSSSITTEDHAREIEGAAGLFSWDLLFSLETPVSVKAGEQVLIQYALSKTNAQLALDYGFIESRSERSAYTLTLKISESDPFLSDKLDIAESNGLGETACFDVFLGCPLPRTLLPYLRLVVLGGTDTFLLESLFRNSVWGHLEFPVSRANEELICQVVRNACKSALSGYHTAIDEDEKLEDGILDPRLEIAIGIRAGEKKVLQQIDAIFKERELKLDGLEYYQERKLKELGPVGQNCKTNSIVECGPCTAGEPSKNLVPFDFRFGAFRFSSEIEFSRQEHPFLNFLYIPSAIVAGNLASSLKALLFQSPKMIQRRRVSLLLILGFLSSVAQSIRFDLQSGHTKCIAEDIKSNSMTVGKYSIVNPNEGHPLPESHKITVRVTSSYGNSYHYADNKESGQFAFQAAEAGDYMACFWAADHKPQTTITVDFDWKTGVAAKDWSNVAKKGSVEVMELELKKMYETVASIHEEMFYLRGREDEMQQLNATTNSRMAWLSFLSLFVCLSVAGLQLWHLKTFFEKKKII